MAMIAHIIANFFITSHRHDVFLHLSTAIKAMSFVHDFEPAISS